MPARVSVQAANARSFVDSEATRRPLAYHGGYRLPERIAATLAALRGGDEAVALMLAAAADFHESIANHNHTARRDAEYALARVDATAAAVTGSHAAAAQRFSQQLHEAFAYLPVIAVGEQPDWSLSDWQEEHKGRVLAGERATAEELRMKLIAIRPN